MAIDEAAAIPLPTVKKLMGPYLVFMSSTGTPHLLSLTLRQTSALALPVFLLFAFTNMM